jgi:5-methylcytosine-specific restriction endonuclease McrBC GTP-binding regulatory subunit McrB
LFYHKLKIKIAAVSEQLNRLPPWYFATIIPQKLKSAEEFRPLSLFEKQPFAQNFENQLLCPIFAHPNNQ